MAKACKGVVIMRKSISESKVQRMRNLVSGDYSSKTKIRSGYTTKRIVRKEGDIWEERGKKWTIKDGIKQTINKLDELRISSKPPLCCPNCNKRMKSGLDKNIYNLFKFCTDCLAWFERKKHEKGEWEEYKNSVQNANFESWLNERKEEYKDFISHRNNRNYVSEAGDIETWSSGQSDEELKAKFDEQVKIIMEKRNEKNKKVKTKRNS